MERTFSDEDLFSFFYDFFVLIWKSQFQINIHAPLLYFSISNTILFYR